MGSNAKRKRALGSGAGGGGAQGATVGAEAAKAAEVRPGGAESSQLLSMAPPPPELAEFIAACDPKALKNILLDAAHTQERITSETLQRRTPDRER